MTKSQSDSMDDEPPLVSVKVTNPIAYLKHWWARVIGNEGIKIKFSFEVKPLTAIGIVLILTSFGLGLNAVTLLLKYSPLYQPLQQFVSAPDKSHKAAYVGYIRHVGDDDTYYLQTSADESIALKMPEKLELEVMVNKQVFATGSYNEQTKLFGLTNIALIASDDVDEKIPANQPSLVPAFIPPPPNPSPPILLPASPATPSLVLPE